MSVVWGYRGQGLEVATTGHYLHFSFFIYLHYLHLQGHCLHFSKLHFKSELLTADYSELEVRVQSG